MDIASISRRASRVSTIFNVLATIVLIFGAIGAVVAVVSAFVAGDGAAEIAQGLLIAIGIVVYVILIWAGIQLSSVIAGYIHVRTQDTQEVA